MTAGGSNRTSVEGTDADSRKPADCMIVKIQTEIFIKINDKKKLKEPLTETLHMQCLQKQILREMKAQRCPDVKQTLHQTLRSLQQTRH